MKHRLKTKESRDTMSVSILLLCGYILSIGFFLNLVWENAQAPLYTGYNGFFRHFWVCFVASIVDAFVLLLLYMLFALFTQNLLWPKSGRYWLFVVLILIGGALAVSFEKWALEQEQWSYTEQMPLVPVLKVGLLPLLQLMVLSGIVFYISAKAIPGY